MKYAMGSILQAGILAATLASATSSMGQAPDTPCSNATLNGTYGALIQGTASALPFAALDLVTANGKGHFEGTGTIAYNGVVTQNVPISAKYAIKPDCSGTVSFSTGATQNLVISHSGDQVQFIRTDDGNAQVTGDAKRVGQHNCSNQSLHGALAATIEGSVSGLPFAALDEVGAGGDGNLVGKGTVSYNGSISEVSFTATYNVNSDCSGSIAFDNGTTQNFIIVGKGSEVRFLRTDDADAVVTGVAKAL
jgi:hypothetical protein